MYIHTFAFSLIKLLSVIANLNNMPDQSTNQSIQVMKCIDFELNGKGDHEQWDKAEWISLSQLRSNIDGYESKIKMMYSDSGLYILGSFQDKLICTDYETDQGDIWNGDVFEVFLQTDPSNPLYFEYEINPLGTELAILVPNNEGDFFGWSPWHYEGKRKIKKAVRVNGGKAKSKAKIDGWTAELFFPFELFKALKQVPPTQGTAWRGNFYRMDYDTGKRISWSWAPITSTFHEYEKFWLLIFQ